MKVEGEVGEEAEGLWSCAGSAGVMSQGPVPPWDPVLSLSGPEREDRCGMGDRLGASLAVGCEGTGR